MLEHFCISTSSLDLARAPFRVPRMLLLRLLQPTTACEAHDSRAKEACEKSEGDRAPLYRPGIHLHVRHEVCVMCDAVVQHAFRLFRT
jgi:hypothetical protein